MTNDDPVVVVERPDEHRFELLVDDEVVGFTEYHDHGQRRSFLHTEVDPAFEGRGLGSRFARAVLDDARTRELDVLPHCPFIRAYIDRHRDEYLDLVPEGDRLKFGFD